MEVNFFAPVELTRSCLPWLLKGTRPLLVNIGSVLAYVAVPDKSEYCASKFALRGWSDAVAYELRGRLDVLLVSPSTTASEFFSAVVESPARFRVGRRQMSPQLVARHIARAMAAGRRELILSVEGRSLVRAQRWFPLLLRPFVARARLVDRGGPRPAE
jgi:short-subunit dehydrogenase